MPTVTQFRQAYDNPINKQLLNPQGLSFEQWLQTPTDFYGGNSPAQMLGYASQGQITNPLDPAQQNFGYQEATGSLMPSSTDMGGFALGLGGLAAIAGPAMMGGAAGGLGGDAAWGVNAAAGEAGTVGLGDAGLGGFYGGIGDGGAAGGLSYSGQGLDSLLGGDTGAGYDFGMTGAEGGSLPGGFTTGASGAQTAIQRILSGSGTAADWASVAGSALPGALQAFGNYQSGQSLQDLASQQRSQFDEFKAMGAPYRTRLSDLYANPSGFLSSPEVQVPVQQGTDALARSLSAKVGNPIDNMTALGELQNYSANQLFGRLGQEKDRLGGFGGLSAYNQAGAGAPLATQLQQLGIGADAGIWGGLGRAAGDVFNPAPTTLADLLKQMQGSNIFQVA